MTCCHDVGYRVVLWRLCGFTFCCCFPRSAWCQGVHAILFAGTLYLHCLARANEVLPVSRWAVARTVNRGKCLTLALFTVPLAPLASFYVQVDDCLLISCFTFYLAFLVCLRVILTVGMTNCTRWLDSHHDTVPAVSPDLGLPWFRFPHSLWVRPMTLRRLSGLTLWSCSHRYRCTVVPQSCPCVDSRPLAGLDSTSWHLVFLHRIWSLPRQKIILLYLLIKWGILFIVSCF